MTVYNASELWQLQQITPPAFEPVSLAQAKRHLRLEGTEDDAHVGALIVTARTWVERFIRRALERQEWRMTWAYGFPDLLRLRLPPVLELAAENAVTYYDPGGTLRTLAPSAYMLDASGSDPVVEPVSVWPDTQQRRGAVLVRYWCGYAENTDDGDPTNAVPAPIKQAMLLLLAHYFENREPVSTSNAVVQNIPHGIESLLGPYRSLRFD